MSVKALYFSVENVGKHMKKTKKRFTWRFIADGKEYMLEMFVSYLSNKKKIFLNGGRIFEEQKNTSSFQFPFQAGKSSCLIVQHGDKFELRINNQVFENLYLQEKMKREFAFSGENNDDYGRKQNGGYNPQYARRQEEQPKRRPDITMDSHDYNPPRPDSTTYSQSQKNINARPKGPWDDVKKAQESVVRKEKPKTSFKPKNESDDEDGGLGFASAFDKFDYKSTPSTTQNTQKKSTSDPFDGFDNKYSGETKVSKSSTQQKELSAFDAFASTPAQKQSVDAFEAFETKPAQKDSFASFEQFSGFNGKPAQIQSKPVRNDLLDLDFGGGSTTQNQQTNQTANTGFDFFEGGSTTVQNQTHNQGFGTQSTQQANSNNFNNGFGNFATNQVNQNQTQGTQDNKKKDLWDTDLVSLSASDTFTNNNQYQNDFGYGGMGGNQMNYGMNTNMGMGNMGMGMNMNTSNNVGYGNNSFGGMNQQGFGGNSNFGGNHFATNQNYGGNTMGQSNFQTQQNFGGNVVFGGSTGISPMNMNQNYNQNAGFGMQMSYQQPVGMAATTADDDATPFD